MIFDEALVNHLLADTDLYQLVGSRIYPLDLPQNKPFPAIVYEEIVANPEHTLDKGQEGLVRSQYQFNVYAKTSKVAKETAVKLRIALNLVQADLSGFKVSARIIDRSDEFTDALRIPSVRMDVEFWYVEEV